MAYLSIGDLKEDSCPNDGRCKTTPHIIEGNHCIHHCLRCGRYIETTSSFSVVAIRPTEFVRNNFPHILPKKPSQ